jgi:TRAP-type C4-dicarboxylate transport system permease large subunit
VAVIYALPVGFLIYKGLTWKNLFESGKEAGTAVGAIMVMILFSMILSQMFVMESVPQQLVEAIFAITENKIVLLIMINIMLFLVGMVVNDVTAIILIAPLLLPLMTAIGVSPIQFAAIMGVNTAMGGVTPPYASILYLGARIGNVKVIQVIKPAMTLILFGYVPVVFLTSLSMVVSCGRTWLILSSVAWAAAPATRVAARTAPVIAIFMAWISLFYQ